MKYISVKETSLRWGIDSSRIGRLCREGRIEGAKRAGRNWVIPEHAQKPQDGRTRQAKAEPSETFFRFPLFVDFEEESFVPPLSTEEAALRLAQKDFYACEFQKAKEAFKPLSESADSVYVKICALYFMCVLSAVYDYKLDWAKYYGELQRLLSEDFPRKTEMRLFLPWLDFNLGSFKTIPKLLHCDPTYELHPDVWYLNAFLSTFCYQEQHREKPSEPFETLCRLMERDGHYAVAQELHAILFYAYFSLPDKTPATYHLRKATRIAYEHNLLFTLADMATYCAEASNAVLAEYPPDFAEKITRLSHAVNSNFAVFFKEHCISIFYNMLTRDDYPLIFYAVEGFSNKELAVKMKLSQRTIADKYKQLYIKLGVAGKVELIALFKAAMGDRRNKGEYSSPRC